MQLEFQETQGALKAGDSTCLRDRQEHLVSQVQQDQEDDLETQDKEVLWAFLDQVVLLVQEGLWARVALEVSLGWRVSQDDLVPLEEMALRVSRVLQAVKKVHLDIPEPQDGEVLLDCRETEEGMVNKEPPVLQVLQVFQALWAPVVEPGPQVRWDYLVKGVLLGLLAEEAKKGGPRDHLARQA